MNGHHPYEEGLDYHQGFDGLNDLFMGSNLRSSSLPLPISGGAWINPPATTGGASLATLNSVAPIISAGSKYLLITHLWARSSLISWWISRPNSVLLRLRDNGGNYLTIIPVSMRTEGVPDTAYPIHNFFLSADVNFDPPMLMGPGSILNGNLSYVYGSGTSSGSTPSVSVQCNGYATTDAALAARMGVVYAAPAASPLSI